MSRRDRSSFFRTSTRWVRLLAVTAVAVLIAAIASPPASGTAGASRHIQRAGDIRIPAGSKPPSLRRGTVTVMLQLRGAPVTVADAARGGRMSKAGKDALRASLRAAQQPVAARAQQLGAKVDHLFQLAYNGIQARVPASRIPALAGIPGVTAVRVMRPQTFDNVNSVPFVGAPAVWGGVGGYTGTGIKLGVIDTGIDYTHADFGGPGTVAAYNNEHALEASAPNPAYVGPGAPRVKGGVDLVGDAYNGANTPQPDTNPLDCNGHGTHVAGTAAGSGVLSDGSTFTGPYNATTVSSHTWNVGPGVAPQASLYAIRVFGCSGSTNETVTAIEWAVDHDMDVINMSLGSSFGRADDPSAEAAGNAALDGMVVVASAGNSGNIRYITGSPATGQGVLSVAADNGIPTLAGANLALSTGPTLPLFRENDISTAGVPASPIKVLTTGGGAVSLGCNPSEYTSAGVTGKIVVVKRGTCARVARAIYGQQAGAVAVVMINNDVGYPPYDGHISSNPDTGIPFNVTIPFLGALASQEAALVAADGGTGTLTDATVANPSVGTTGAFSSAGPRNGDSWLKPSVTAPGVETVSAGVGTGTGSLTLSGTSMASPHVAGVAALVRQAHPSWTQTKIRAAIVDTSDPSLVPGAYTPRRNGVGEVLAPPAVATDVVAFGPKQETALNFGYLRAPGDLSLVKKVKVVNGAASAVTLNIGTRLDGGKPHSIVAVPPVTIAAHHTKTIPITLNVPAATAGSADPFNEAYGQITFTPAAGQNHDVVLAVPYYLVTSANSKIHSTVSWGTPTSGTATTTNAGGIIPGVADWYVWGLQDTSGDGGQGADLRSVGVSSVDASTLAFGMNSWSKWSSPVTVTPEVHVDIGDNGTEDYIVYSQDLGRAQGGAFSGEAVTLVYDVRTGSASAFFDTEMPFNGRSLYMLVNVSQLCRSGSPCLSAGNPRFSYTAVWYDEDGVPDTSTGEGHFNHFTPAISSGMAFVVAPGGSVNTPLTINPAEAALSPYLGLMVITHDNALPAQAQLISVP